MGGRTVVVAGLSLFAVAQSAWARPARMENAAVLRVYVVNAAEVSSNVVQTAENEVTSIFAAAGVRLGWVQTPATGRDFDIVVRIASGTNLAGLNVAAREMTLGFAIVAREKPGLRGQIVCVRFDQLEKYTSGLPISITLLMGLVIAHEIGHLLLPEGHSSVGLMRAAWDLRCLTPMYFTAPQVRAIRARLASIER